MRQRNGAGSCPDCCNYVNEGLTSEVCFPFRVPSSRFEQAAVKVAKYKYVVPSYFNITQTLVYQWDQLPHAVENIYTFHHLVEDGGTTIAALCLHFFWEVSPRGNLGFYFPFLCFFSASAHTRMSSSRAWKRSRRELLSLNAVLSEDGASECDRLRIRCLHRQNSRTLTLQLTQSILLQTFGTAQHFKPLFISPHNPATKLIFLAGVCRKVER